MAVAQCHASPLFYEMVIDGSKGVRRCGGIVDYLVKVEFIFIYIIMPTVNKTFGKFHRRDYSANVRGLYPVINVTRNVLVLDDVTTTTSFIFFASLPQALLNNSF